MNNIKNLNYPAQLWLGDSDSLELSLIEHLRKNFCLNENNIICDINNICSPDNLPIDKNVFVSERVISSTLVQYGGPDDDDPARKIRLYVWLD